MSEEPSLDEVFDKLARHIEAHASALQPEIAALLTDSVLRARRSVSVEDLNLLVRNMVIEAIKTSTAPAAQKLRTIAWVSSWPPTKPKP